MIPTKFLITESFVKKNGSSENAYRFLSPPQPLTPNPQSGLDPQFVCWYPPYNCCAWAIFVKIIAGGCMKSHMTVLPATVWRFHKQASRWWSLCAASHRVLFWEPLHISCDQRLQTHMQAVPGCLSFSHSTAHTLTHVSHACTFFLGAFAKLRKRTTSFVMPVRLSA